MFDSSSPGRREASRPGDPFSEEVMDCRVEPGNDTPDGACCKLIGTITPVEEIHGPGAGIAVRKGDDELRESLNKAIAAIRANGKYKEINDKYFKFDVYGSDS